MRFVAIAFVFFSYSGHGQVQFDVRNIKFGNLDFATTREKIINKFGKPEIIETNYDCGYFANDQPGGPYYQVIYPNFNYIGSDKEKFFLQSVDFDGSEKIKMKYQGFELSGLTTKTDFSKIFGDRFINGKNDEVLLLLCANDDDGAKFTFKEGKLVKFEYWTPC